MRQIDEKPQRLLGGVAQDSDTNPGQSANEPNKPSDGIKIPWWLFRLFQWIVAKSPILGETVFLLLQEFTLSVLTVWKVLKNTLKTLLILGVLVVAYLLLDRASGALGVNKIPWYFMLVPPALAIGALILVHFLRKKQPTSTNKLWSLLKENWKVPVALVILHLGAFMLLEGVLYKKYIWSWVAVYAQVGLALAFVLRERPKNAKPAGHLLGTTILVFIVLLIGKEFTPIKGYIKEWSGKNADTNSTVAVAPMVGVNLERTPCLEAEKGGDSEKIREALKDYPDLLAVACRESGLNHMDPKDPGEVLVGEDDSRDTGFLQINTHFHPAEVMKGAVGCGDPKDFDCQVKYVKYLHDTSGLESWFPYGPNESGRQYKPLTVLLVASKEYGSRIHIPRITDEYRFDHDKPVVVEAEDYDGKKNEYTLKPKEYTPVPGFNKWMRFKSVDGSPVAVKVTYKFQQVP